jgi:hypothetical protein
MTPGLGRVQTDGNETAYIENVAESALVDEGEAAERNPQDATSTKTHSCFDSLR